MPKLRELSYEERHTIKILRENGLSFPKIGKIVGCHHSTALRIYRSFEATNSIEKLPRTGRPRKFDKRGERIACRTAKRLRFESLRNISRQSRSWLCLTGGGGNFGWQILPRGADNLTYLGIIRPLHNASNREGRYFDLYYIVSSIWKAMI